MTDRLTEFRRDKSPARYMEARTGRHTESASADFHELPTGGCARQDFSPPIRGGL